MKEELTTAMHSEFSVSNETDVKHKVWSVLSRSNREKSDPTDLLKVYGLTIVQFNRYKDSYNPR